MEIFNNIKEETAMIWTDYFLLAAKSIDHIPGTYVECGFGYGNTARIVLDLMQALSIRKRNVCYFDSFEGFPEPTQEDYSAIRNVKKGEVSWPIERAYDVAWRAQNHIGVKAGISKGYFEDTLKQYNMGPIAILHLDCDLYKSYKTCLNTLYDHVSPGGIILFDEYKAAAHLARFPGAAIAIDEFFWQRKLSGYPVDLTSVTFTHQPADIHGPKIKYYVRKPLTEPWHYSG